jgi:hypothetical protein
MESLPEFRWCDMLIHEDEKHMAAALLLIQKAIAQRENTDIHWGAIHACLREASFHCEEARKHWTNERQEQFQALGKKIFGDI